MRADEQPPSPFLGQWIGETQGCESPAHLWEIRRRGRWLYIQTRWEGEDPQPGSFYVTPGDDPSVIQIHAAEAFTATLVDPQHFVIPGWDTNDIRGDEGPAYDVVFSRPGLAELTAREAYLRYLQARDGQPPDTPGDA